MIASVRRRSARPRASTSPPAAAASTSANASSTRVRPARSTEVRLDPTVPRTVAMSVTATRVRPPRARRVGDRRGVDPAGVDEERADRVTAGLRARRRRRWRRRSCPSARSGTRRRRRRSGTAPSIWLLRAAVDQPQVDAIAEVQLVVLDRLRADQNRVGLAAAACASARRAVPPLEVAVLQCGRPHGSCSGRTPNRSCRSAPT